MKTMNKTELIKAIATKAELDKKQAAAALDAITSSVIDALKADDTVQLTGFGTFVVRTRAARTGHNPATGEAIQIAESKASSFKAGKALKDAVNR